MAAQVPGEAAGIDKTAGQPARTVEGFADQPIGIADLAQTIGGGKPGGPGAQDQNSWHGGALKSENR
ncbi:MAG: hypothetical protein BWZ10_02310 [candidate division BRC1 bacterium ADurb.BinA364]|nr:MAG: hypothetical protein BWZ10_02310 [candidate division BRC1 bacterium ADurb.BinA364]